MKILIKLLFPLSSIISFSQEITGNELLAKTIQFHDPENNWSTFAGTFLVTMKTPNQSPRISKITVNLPNEYFRVRATRDSISNIYELDKKKCSTSTIGLQFKKELTEEEWKKKIEEDCKKANVYKNYYTYLYGLPMKLKDDGTIIHQKVEKRKFKEKEYLVLKATYNKEVGKDIWYFYFNPKTYAMEVYQFFKKTKDSGEYIVLSGLETINNIKMPKVRTWYYNKDNKYLGTDTLSITK
ncbi:hypothetical protein DUT90_12305 [Polaribacter sp. WD7]|uniref:DUF6503 family protein n=1 Tax=Polaribacter sp. WD7 TaxID=2269061 RepID=UPI000DF2CA9A|nr:DUF6503 family protein [Polaribacter sp. WD7]RCS26532.1 hypothetical protein DUT90_12305 [Polaribacter sp. WD7]